MADDLNSLGQKLIQQLPIKGAAQSRLTGAPIFALPDQQFNEMNPSVADYIQGRDAFTLTPGGVMGNYVDPSYNVSPLLGKMLDFMQRQKTPISALSQTTAANQPTTIKHEATHQFFMPTANLIDVFKFVPPHLKDSLVSMLGDAARDEVPAFAGSRPEEIGMTKEEGKDFMKAYIREHIKRGFLDSKDGPFLENYYGVNK